MYLRSNFWTWSSNRDREELPFLRTGSAMENWTPPTNPKELQIFLGFANFYRQFVTRFSIIAAPLLALLSEKKYSKFCFGEEQMEAFSILKKAFLKNSILKHYLSGRPLILETVTSPVGVGAVLLQQEQPDSRWNSVAHVLHGLSAAEQKYEV